MSEPAPPAGGGRPPSGFGPRASLKILPKIGYLLGARWFQEGLTTVFFIALARVSTTTFGDFMMALGLGSILLMVAEFGLNLPLVRLAAGPPEKRSAVLSQVLTLKLGCLLLAGLGALGFVFWQDYPRGLAGLLLLIGLGVALEAVASTFFVVLQVEGRQDLEAKIRAAGTLGGFGFGLTALVLGAPPLVIALFKVIDSILKMIGCLWLAWRRQHLHWRRPHLASLWSLLRLGMIFALMEITASVYNKANLFFLQRQGGSEAVAQYSAAWQVVDGVSCLVANLVLQNILYPVFVRLWHQDRPAVVPLARQTAAWLLAAAMPLMFFLWVESDRLIPLVFGPDFSQAVWLQRILVLTILIAFWHNLALFLLLSMGWEKPLLGVYVLGLAVNLFWCAVILPRNPLLGAALAIIVTKGLVAVGTIGMVHHRLGFWAGRDLGEAAMAVAAAIMVYLAGMRTLPREAAEALTLIPFGVLAWRWWQSKVRAAQTS